MKAAELRQPLFPALAEPLVRVYMRGQAVSAIGSWVQNITLNLLVWQLTQSPALLGLLNFVIIGPNVVVAPLAGPWIQPHNARRITRTLVLCTTATSLAMCAVAAMVAGGHLAATPAVAAIMVMAFFRGVFGAAETPARQVMLASCVTDASRIGNAVAMNSVLFNAARVVGPAIAAFLFGMWGAAAGLALTAAAGAYNFANLRHMPVAERVPRALRKKASFAVALRWVVSDPKASLQLPITACLALLASSYVTLVPVLAGLVFGNAARWTAWFFAAAGLGSTIAALILSSKWRLAAGRWLEVPMPFAASVALGVVALGSGLAGNLASDWAALGIGSTLVAFGVLGFAVTFTGPGTNAAIQQKAPDELRGALAGLYLMCFVGVMPFGHLLAGSLAQVWGVRSAFAVMAGGLLVLLLALLAWNRRRRSD